MIADDIKNYAKQFEWEPVIENAAKNRTAKTPSKFILIGMGGSHLAADILRQWHPEKSILIHSGYGLPRLSEKDLKESSIILSSYSGNTEEVVDAFAAAKAKHLKFTVISARGKLMQLAQKNKIPYVAMPDLKMQPRMVLGYSLLAILAAMGEKSLIAELRELAKDLHPAREEHRGRDLARRLLDAVPVVYASARNFAVAQNWKIKFNETGKIPAFWNVVPELNHNEMTGFDAKGKTTPLSRRFHFVFLKDGSDDPRVIKRMSILEKLYRDRGLKTEVVLLQGKNEPLKIFNALVLADWTAYHLAKSYGVDPEQVPMVEEFKGLIARWAAK